MADPRTARLAEAEVKTRGYVINEDGDYALRDLSLALDAVAELIEGTGEKAEIPEGHLGALLRVFSRQAKAIAAEALFANHVMARPRSVN